MDITANLPTEPEAVPAWEPPVQPPRKKLKRRVLEMLQSATYWCGGTTLFEALHSDRSATILMYHSIATRKESQWVAQENRISAAVFEQQVRFLAESRSVLSMSELVRRLKERESFPPGSVVLTFDDGYADNLRVALPILKRYGVPATFYIPTAYVEQQRNQWVDELNAAFRGRRVGCLELPDRSEYELDSPTDCRQAFRAACDLLSTAIPSERRPLLDDLIGQLSPTVRPPRLVMTWDEVREIAELNPQFEVGSHSVNHVDLDRHADLAEDEVQSSIRQITERLGRPPRHFAFPYNRSSERARRAVAGSGLQSAVVGDGRDCVVRSGSDVFALPRIAAPNSLNRLRLLSSEAYPDFSQTLFGRP